MAEERQQFTFYRSFWEAIKGLPKKDRLPILEAIIEYALDEKQPEALGQTQRGFFSLVKPTLDAARKKAEAGKQGGSKPKAKSKQNGREKEKEEEKENENEIEGEKEKKQPSVSDELFEAFWTAYPNCAKSDAFTAQKAWDKLKLDDAGRREILRTLEAWKVSKRWIDDGGAFIPKPENFLDPARGYLRAAPAPDTSRGVHGGKRSMDEDERAAIQRLMREE